MIALLVIGLLLVGVWQPLEYLAYSGLFHLRGSRSWSDRVVVIEIDQASLTELGQFPWSRQSYTDLLNVLTPANPTAIVLDLLLSEPSAEDEALATAMRRSGRVFMAQSWDDIGRPLEPAPLLQAATPGTGHIDRQEDADGLVRRVELQKYNVPALGLLAAQLHADQIGQPISLPDLNAPLWVNWSAPTSQITHYSFIKTLQGSIPISAFRNKVVLIGVTAPSLDTLSTPYDRSPPTSGVYLQAAVISNLLQQDFLKCPGQGWLPLALILVGSGLSLSLPACQTTSQLMRWIGVSLGWGLISLIAFQKGYWLPVMTPLVLFALTTVAVVLVDQYHITQLLSQSEERYALAVRGSNEGLWDWNLTLDTIYLSPRWMAMLGYGDQELDVHPASLTFLQRWYQQQHHSLSEQRPSYTWFKQVHPDDIQSLREAIAAHLQGQTPHLEVEYRMRHRDGDYRWVLSRGLAVQDKKGRAYRMVGSQSDITARKEAEETLRRSAFYDVLTGLPNRALFLQRLQEAIALSQQFSTISFAVLWLDLDHFKVLNNSLGNEIGDRLLVATAQRLKAFLLAEDVLARIGGDEFIILLNQIRDVTDATRMADRVQQLLALPFNLDGHEIFTSISIGIALSSLLYQQPEHLLRDADTAMHQAKAAGRSRYRVFDTAMHLRLRERLQLENDLRRAITANLYEESDRQELQLYYQPIIRLATAEVAGFEALIRWNHPDRGLISPVRFIPMAEETGLIIQMGWWVLRQACRQMRQWHNQFAAPLTINVNLSSKQFSMSGLTEQICQILNDSGLEAEYLKLELTESTVMENAASVVSVLQQIRYLGIQLAIDDFGTGYSSLSYLPRFPINTLKIDRSFVKRIGINPDDREIVHTILYLAHNLKMDVTAEGVETAEQSAQLLEMGCEYGQGYLFSKPLDSEAATIFLNQQFNR